MDLDLQRCTQRTSLGSEEHRSLTKVHLYSGEGDVLYATKNLLGVHSVSGGRRTYQLPRAVEVVYDLFDKRAVARNSASFDITLEAASTALFYVGQENLLTSLD